MRTNRKPVTEPLRTGPSPFLREAEVRLSGMGLWSTLLGFCVLMVMRFLLPAAGGQLPSLSALTVWAFGTAGFYFGVRFVAFGIVRPRARREYREKNPGARVFPQSELPRDLFLLASLAPVASLIPLCFCLLVTGTRVGPQLWILISVGAALSLRDLTGAAHILFVDPSRWIKETSAGLDILDTAGEDRS
jgi:hypothetical protein